MIPSIFWSWMRSLFIQRTCEVAESLDKILTIDSLRDDDMAYLMSMNTKELHKLCGRLKEDRFLAVYVSSQK